MGFKKSSGSKVLVEDAGKWTFGRGKHQGRGLEEVASVDSGYVQWLLKEAGTSLTDQAFYALTDVLDKKNDKK